MKAIILLFTALISSTTWAAKKHKPAEVYAAVEDDDGPPSSLRVTTTTTVQASPSQTKKESIAPARSSPNYDSVPLNQRESIARRLKLIEQLVREYGRAYDYRSHTNQDLEKILAQLETPPAPPAAETRTQ